MNQVYKSTKKQSKMIDKKDFQKIKQELDFLEKKKEELNKATREIVRLSKKIIYLLHQGNLEKIQKFISLIKKRKEEMEKIAKSCDLTSELGYRIASQEYAEAMLYYFFVKEGKVVSLAKIRVGLDSYLSGLSDFAGELFRRAVNFGIKERFQEVEQIKKTVEEIYEQMLFLELKGELRKKFDSIKYYLMKLEDLILEIKLRK